VRKNIYLSLAIIWTCSILLLCLEPASELPKIEINNLDKIVHFVFHLVFIFLWYLYLFSKRKSTNYSTPIILFFVSLVFGILIEFFQQTFTTSRNGDLLDIVSNISGAITAILTLILFQYFRNIKRI
jgi:VanZ family protein